MVEISESGDIITLKGIRKEFYSHYHDGYPLLDNRAMFAGAPWRSPESEGLDRKENNRMSLGGEELYHKGARAVKLGRSFMRYTR